MNKVARQNQSGVALLEALFAILIFSFGVLGLIGLFASTAKTTTQSKTRSDASLLANECLAKAWGYRLNAGDLVNMAGDQNCLPDVSAILPQGRRVVQVAGTQVTVTITWRMPGENADNSFVSRTDVFTDNNP